MTEVTPKRKCRECREYKEDTSEDSGLCQPCKEYYHFCHTCYKWVSKENGCRHIGYAEGYGYAGCGSDAPFDDHKESFMLLLDKLDRDLEVCCCHVPLLRNQVTDKAKPREAIKLLRKAVYKHAFSTFFHGYLLDPTVTYDFQSWDRSGRPHVFAVLPASTTAGWLTENKDVEDKLGMGVAWIQSLYRKDDKKANQATVRWIDEWLKKAKKP